MHHLWRRRDLYDGDVPWLQAEGYRIPKDVAIASLYNSTNLDCYSPAVTAVSVAASQMGGTAVRQLIQRLRGKIMRRRRCWITTFYSKIDKLT